MRSDVDDLRCPQELIVGMLLLGEQEEARRALLGPLMSLRVVATFGRFSSRRSHKGLGASELGLSINR